MPENEYHCVTLAAGFGTRMGEMGAALPKGLISVNDNTVIDRIIEDTRQDPRVLETVTVSNNRFFDQYDEWRKKAGLSESVGLINNGVDDPDNRLGAIGDLMLVLDKMNWWGKDVLVNPSDTLYGFKMSQFLDFCEGKNGLITVVSRAKSKDIIANRLGCAVLKGDQIVNFEEKPKKPKSNYLSVPIYVYKAETLALLKEYEHEGGNMDTPGSVIPWLIEKGIPVYAFVSKESLDVGTPDDVLKAQEFSELR